MLFHPMATVAILAKFLGLAFSALLPLINPFGSALILLGLVGDQPISVYRDLARKIAINTILFLLVVELVGTALLAFFGISLPVVQVSGGLVLASMGWSLLNKPDARDETKTEAAEASTGTLSQKIFYPLTFPVTAGPGSIVVMLTLTAHASTKDLLSNVLAHVGIFLAVVVLSVTVFICYTYAPRISQRVSPPTAHGILRVIAFVLLSIGVQITWNGVESLIKSAMKS
jgi:multiple antibiotic resistance protein